MIFAHLEPITVDACSTATIECSASGYERITWKSYQAIYQIYYKWQKCLILVQENYISSYLKFINIAWYFRGIYYCTAKNSAGEVDSELADLKYQINEHS